MPQKLEQEEPFLRRSLDEEYKIKQPQAGLNVLYKYGFLILGLLLYSIALVTSTLHFALTDIKCASRLSTYCKSKILF